MRLLGNVVPATHGETVADEVLGSGDGTARPPAVHAAQAGADPRLGRDDQRGGQHAARCGSTGCCGPRCRRCSWPVREDRVYVVRIDDDARATVIFGDGVRGARLPTGQENVRARYRSGIGPAGRGVGRTPSRCCRSAARRRAGDNPQPATGGAAPETLDEARANAPLTVLTLDRVVSLRDHEDFARAFGGIAKARAVALPVRTRRYSIHLTVAAAGGAAVDDEHDRPTCASALADVRRPAGPVARSTVSSRNPFEVGVALLTDPALAQVRGRGRRCGRPCEPSFAADRRSFGQPVTAAEVIADSPSRSRGRGGHADRTAPAPRERRD